MAVVSAGPYAKHLHFAPLNFYGPGILPATQPTVSKHRRHYKYREVQKIQITAY